MALGVLLPFVFHAAGGMGQVFLPMHIPVLLAGMLLGPLAGLCVGILTPLLSSLLSGMPPVLPVLPIMVAELACYGLAGGYAYRVQRLPLLSSLVVMLVAGRLAMAAAVLLVGQSVQIDLPPLDYVVAAVTTGMPGILLQIVLVPGLVNRLEPIFVRRGVVQRCA